MRLCRAEKAETRGSDGKIAIPCFRTSAKTAGIHHIWWIPAVFLHFLPKVQTQPRNTTYYAYLGAYNFFMSRIGNGGRRPVPPCAPWARSRTGAGHTARWRRVPACGGTGLWTAACSPARCVRAARLRSVCAGALKLRRSVQVRPAPRRTGGVRRCGHGPSARSARCVSAAAARRVYGRQYVPRRGVWATYLRSAWAGPCSYGSRCPAASVRARLPLFGIFPLIGGIAFEKSFAVCTFSDAAPDRRGSGSGGL